ncbi:hypothetical protein KCMC57_up58020 [Kitasatospora sp. CMC57]|uniref:High frequency lysogenization protein HflD n=1 Tax=Kitasatospora sp. CMC57 TaxID=3231513 RepID=A0AB33K6E1_9ACTN
MAVPRSLARSGAVLGGALTLLALAAPPAPAHPLGNFSVNHYVGLTVHGDGIDALAVTDLAEIPTLQEQPQVDLDHDGSAQDSELAAWAGRRCAETAHRLKLTDSSGSVASWTVTDASFRYQDGTAGLTTSRLECRLHAAVRVARVGSAFRVETGADPTRVGWNEITARGDGATIESSDVPQNSVSQELRDYPRDLLDSPRGVTEAAFRARPGGGSATVTSSQADPSAGGPSAWLAALDARLARMGAAHHLTWPIGLLAVLLSIVLGAGHALLPGHGKTVMATYLAGRRGSRRDALTVGATVTLTHTAGVLITGLLLTVFSSLAGDTLLGWLGVISGALVALVGASLLRDAARATRTSRCEQTVIEPLHAQPAPLVAAGVGSHSAADTHHPHPHDHDHPHSHSHSHSHSHDAHEHRHSSGHPDLPHQHHDHAGHHHRHGLFGHSHRHHGSGADRPSRRTLIGLGVAGGLVPSPSALVVLLGAVALGRTLFGAGLVLAYGVGMAATLTAAGLLLVGVGDRIAEAADSPILGRLRRIAPYGGWLTALLILTVGLGMALRSLPAVL